MSAMRVCACRVFCLRCVHVVACHGTNEMHAHAHAHATTLYVWMKTGGATGTLAVSHASIFLGLVASTRGASTQQVLFSCPSILGFSPPFPYFSSWPLYLREFLCECVYTKMKVVMDAVKADCYRALALLLLHVSLLHASWSVSASLPL